MSTTPPPVPQQAISPERFFAPHTECWIANGGCFEEGRCLHKCQPRLPSADANAELATALRLLKDLSAYITLFRSMTKYVDGSSIGIAMKEAQALIGKHKP